MLTMNTSIKYDTINIMAILNDKNNNNDYYQLLLIYKQ